MLQEEIAENKGKMKTLSNQIERLREDITGKELALAKDHQERKRLEKENESLKVLQSGSVVLSKIKPWRSGFTPSEQYQHLVHVSVCPATGGAAVH